MGALFTFRYVKTSLNCEVENCELPLKYFKYQKKLEIRWVEK